MTVGSQFAELLDREIDASRRGDAIDPDPLGRWLVSMLDANVRVLPNDASGRRYERLLSRVVQASLEALQLRADDVAGPSNLAMLAHWMQARELAESVDGFPGRQGDRSNGLVPAEPRDCLDILYDVAAVIESMEAQRGWRYCANLRAELDSTIADWPGQFGWMMRPEADIEVDSDEIDEAYETRDRLKWSLLCLDLFKLEFPGRLTELDVEHYRHLLVEPDQDFRELVKKAKREGWHQPDATAPKSFWWRAK